ncbi:NAD(P)H-binding protein [Alkalimarinus sediminis]|uniref:NAD(P)H-binding protein n=1 Tax=Alkalimarinus sediminis TaxID=1632866 RepID=A0A9E8HLG8_9ALTE|nr:NAD(P)H-binding protein [Alkalimarinus sediminis]UZW76495.1 NAD(P)H-binding protein [Alkalimarinus sediminis]
MSHRRKALVVGATGLIGGECVRQALALDSYSEVVVFGRRKLSLAHSRLTQIIGPLAEAEALLKDCKVDDVFCCLGTTIKKAKTQANFKTVDYEYPVSIAEVMLNNGAEHFCVVSATGANASSYFFYNRVKGELEKKLESLGYPYLTIMRPSLLVGDRDEVRLGESLSAAVGAVIKPLMKGPLLEISPVDADKVARVMVREAEKIKDGLRYQNRLVIKSREIQEYDHKGA